MFKLDLRRVNFVLIVKCNFINDYYYLSTLLIHMIVFHSRYSRVKLKAQVLRDHCINDCYVNRLQAKNAVLGSVFALRIIF